MQWAVPYPSRWKEEMRVNFVWEIISGSLKKTWEVKTMMSPEKRIYDERKSANLVWC